MADAAADDPRLWRLLAGAIVRRIRRRLRVGVMHPLRFAGPTPERILVAPPDLRPGDTAVARDFYAGRYPLAGQVRETAGSPFESGLGDAAFSAAIHDFAWLRHLRAAGTELAASNARALVQDWMRMAADTLEGPAWTPATTARRIIAWLQHSPLILLGAELPFYRGFLRALALQARYLAAVAPDVGPGAARLQVRIALAFAALALPASSARIARAGRDLQREIEAQILPDGGHVSRNAETVADLLADLLPLRQTYASQAEAPPAILQAAIDRMAQALRFHRLDDGGLARFNGCAAVEPGLLDAVLGQVEGGSPPLSAPQSGYQRLSLDGATAIVDAGAPPPPELAALAHAGTLSFELASGGDLFVVNVGVATAGPEEWRPLSRSTAAHSTATLADTSSARFTLGGRAGEMFGAPLVGGPRRVNAARQDSAAAQAVRADHDGYARAFGVLHERTLTLSAGRLDGVDRFPDAEDGRSAAPVDGALRFHLHPAIGVWRDGDGRIVLSAPDGDAWAFSCGDVAATVEESLYFAGPAAPRKTLQIVIDFNLAERRQVAWRFERTVRRAA